MPQDRVFSAYADYYDLLYRDKDYEAEATGVVAVLERHATDIRKILDLGCGTGRHAASLARRGYHVIGVDLSQEMLKQAAARSADHKGAVGGLEFVRGDARTVRLDRTVDAVISLFHVMSYQTTDADLGAAFETAAAHLDPGGLFLFDMWYGPAVLSDPPVTRVKRLESDMLKIVRIAEPVMRMAENIVDVRYQVFARSPQAGDWLAFDEVHSMRYLFDLDLHRLLPASGFEVVQIFDWDSGAPPTASSWNVCCVARRRN